MYAVLEEIEDGMACLVPDSREKPLYIPVTSIPEPYEIGDVFLVEESQGAQEVYLKRDSDERERRLEANRSKRKRLLNMSHNKKPDKKN